MCTSFQKRVVAILTKKTKHALQEYNVKNLIVAGGVAANKGLRKNGIKQMSKLAPFLLISSWSIWESISLV